DRAVRGEHDLRRRSQPVAGGTRARRHAEARQLDGGEDPGVPVPEGPGARKQCLGRQPGELCGNGPGAARWRIHLRPVAGIPAHCGRRRPRQALRLDSELRLHRYRFVPGRDAGTMTFTVGYDDALLFDDKHPWDDAQRELMDAGFGDGLPLVVPTAARMEGMLRGMASHSVGQMPPLFGELTPEAVAYCCVLAGCVAAELPVVLTAAAATLKDEFNLL